MFDGIGDARQSVSSLGFPLHPQVFPLRPIGMWAAIPRGLKLQPHLAFYTPCTGVSVNAKLFDVSVAYRKRISYLCSRVKVHKEPFGRQDFFAYVVLLTECKVIKKFCKYKHLFVKFYGCFCATIVNYLSMKGIDLKFFLANKGYTVSRIAQMIDESQQNFSAAIKSDNIKTNLIERISAATGIPISEFYGEKKTTLSASMTGGNNNRMIAGNGNSMGDSSAELEALRRENELLKKWMAEKDGQIEFLRELLKK